MKKLTLTIAAALLLALLAPVASAAVLVDTWSNSSWWNSFQGNGQGIGNYYDTGKRNIVAPFMGNGETLGRVGMVTSFRDGDAQPYNNPQEGDFTLRGAIFSSFADFASDTWAENRPQGMFFEFTTAELQTGWQTPIGMRGSYNLYYLEVNFSTLGYTTQNGVVQGVSLVGDGQSTSSGALTLGQLSQGGFSPQSPFWYASTSINGGVPGTFTSMGFPANDAAWFVETNPVPEPATMLALGYGVVSLCRRRFFRPKKT